MLKAVATTSLCLLLMACGANNSNKENNDLDNDGVINIEDNCPELSNSNQADLDGDSLGDLCDGDRDGDSVNNEDDAFPDDSTESADADGDGYGDNSDKFPNDASEWLDTDSDGVGDNSDQFPNDASESVDTDGDGVGDNADAFDNMPEYQTDTDSDGMADKWEDLHTGLDKTSDDSTGDLDGDSLINLSEFIANSDPNDEDSDDDKLTDYEEYNAGLNPNSDVDGEQVDSDRDGLVNYAEIEGGSSPLDPEDTASAYFMVNQTNDGQLLNSASADRAGTDTTGRWIFTRNNNHQFNIKDTYTGEVQLVVNIDFGDSLDNGGLSVGARYMVFDSNSPNLVAAANSGARQVYRKDMITGDLLLVSTDENGSLVSGDSNEPWISADGNYVVFTSTAQLVSIDTDSTKDVYLKDLSDLSNITTTLISHNNDPDPINAASANGVSERPAVNVDANGTVKIAFISTATDLHSDYDPGGATNLYLWQVGEPLKILSKADRVSDTWVNGPFFSGNGERVVFICETNLVDEDTNGDYDAYLWDASKPSNDALTLISVDKSGVQGNDGSAPRSISGDGKYVFLASFSTNWYSGITERVLYVKDIALGDLTFVSLNKDGNLPDDGIAGNAFNYGFGSAADFSSFITKTRATNLDARKSSIQASGSNEDTFKRSISSDIVPRVDTDGDGLTDSIELASLTDPNDTDTDNDGLSDYDEIHEHRTSPFNADTDGDGTNDGDEITANTDPFQ